LHPTDHLCSAKAFLQVIRNLLASRAGAADENKELRKFAVARYSWRRAAEHYVETATQLLALNRSSGAASKASHGSAKGVSASV
jgi:hypothetical protein